jgi:hypothetical protein
MAEREPGKPSGPARAGTRPESVDPAPPAKARPKEIGGPEGPEPTRYGDWEKNGRCSDF